MKVIDTDTGKEFNLNLTTPAFLEDMKNFHDSACAHPQKELRRVFMRDGRPGYQDQCQDCGKLVGQYKSASLASPETLDADPEMLPQYEREREAKRGAIYQKHVRLQRRGWDNFKERYRAYLKSEAWRRKRQKVIDKAKGVCEGCGERPATQVHHINYDRVGHELLIDLAALCGACHSSCHPDHTSYPGEEELEAESPCAGCRWQWSDGQGPDICGALSIPAAEALSWDDLCPTVREPLR